MLQGLSGPHPRAIGPDRRAPLPRKAVGATHHPSERGRSRPGPLGPVAHWLLADGDMAIVRDAIVAAGVAVVSIGIWDLIFWVSSLQFPVE
jgi:hypothetical protein